MEMTYAVSWRCHMIRPMKKNTGFVCTLYVRIQWDLNGIVSGMVRGVMGS